MSQKNNKSLLKKGPFSEEKFQKIFELSPQAIIVFDHQGRIAEINGRVSDWLGYDRSSVLGKGLKDLPFLPTHSKLLVLKKFTQRMAGVKLEPYDLDFVDKKGNTIIGNIVGAALTGDNGEKYDIVMISDVTEKRLSEEKVLVDKSELEKKGRLLTSINKAVKIFLEHDDWSKVIEEVLATLGKSVDVSRCYVFKNFQQDEKLFSRYEFEWVDKKNNIRPQIKVKELQNFDYVKSGFGKWIEKLEKDETIMGDVSSMNDKIKKILSSQNIKSILIVPIFVRSQWWGFLGFDECLTERTWDSTEIELLKVVASITGSAIERSEALKKIAKSEERFRSLFDNMSSGVAVYKPVDDGNDFVFVDYNKAAEEMDHRSKKNVLGKKVTTVFPAVKEFGLFNILVQVYKTGKHENLSISKYEDEDLDTWREGHVYPLSSGEIVAVYDDVTQKKEAEENSREKLEEMEKINRLMVGRELKMIELKEEIKSLERKVRKHT